jgi:hypothetical protein
VYQISHLQAFDIVLEGALVEVVDEVGLVVLVFLEPLLQRVEHDAAQLLYIVLLPGYGGGDKRTGLSSTVIP